MTKRKLVAVLVAFAMLIGGLPVSGLGVYATEKIAPNAEGVYEISTAADLMEFVELVNSGSENENLDAVLVDDIVINDGYSFAEDGTYTYNGSGDVPEINKWTPIGTYSGTFDGDGHSISGIYGVVDNTNVGFVKMLYEGTVKNLTIKNSYFESNRGFSGAIVAVNYAGTVSNCHTEATVTVKCTADADYNSPGTGAAGIVGQNRLYGGQQAKVLGCSNAATIISYGNVGAGIVGYSYANGSNDTDYATIENCSNSGFVTMHKGGTSGNQYAGGIIGNSGAFTAGNSKITNCYNTGTITNEAAGYTGGITGYDYRGVVTRCYNEGDVINGTYKGGVAGQISNSTVTNCYNTGDVSGSDPGYGYTGGIIGSCYLPEKTISLVVDNCYNAGSVEGKNSGGAIGTIMAPSTGRTVEITDCYYDSDIYTGEAYTIDDPGNFDNKNIDNVDGKTTAQFSSGEVACLLGSPFGQNIDNGEEVQNAPVLDGAKIYAKYENCEATSASSYSNSPDGAGNATQGHSWKYTENDNTIEASCENTYCTIAEEDQPIIISLKLKDDTDLTYDGTEKEVEVVQSVEVFDDINIEYTDAGGNAVEDNACIEVGVYTANITLGNATASLEFEIVEKGNSVNEYRIAVCTTPAYYGDNFRILDFSKMTCNGAEFTNTMISNGISASLISKSTGKEYTLPFESNVPAGDYRVEIASISPDDTENSYGVLGDDTFVVKPRVLNTSSFTVSAKDKDYNGTVEAEFEVTAKDSVLAADVAAGKVSIKVKGEFDNAEADEDKTVNYVITLSGEGADNYSVPEGGITGTTKGNILPATIPDQDGDGNPEVDSDGDNIYEGSDPDKDKEYVKDKDGNILEVIKTIEFDYEKPVAGEALNKEVKNLADNVIASLNWEHDGKEINGKADYNTEYVARIELSAKENYTILEDVTVKVNSETVNASVENGKIVITQTYVTEKDTEAPTVEITVKDNVWKELLNTVTFSKFFKESQKVIVDVNDNSDIASIEYYVSDKALAEDKIKNIQWSGYNGAFNIVPNAKLVIYAKATDNAGNVTIVNSEGIVLYTDSTAPAASYEYTQDINMDIPEIKIELNGNTINSVMMRDESVNEEDYTAADDGTIVFAREYLDSLEAGNKDVTIFVDPQGVEYPRMRSTNDVPANLSINLNVIDTKKNDDGTISADNNGDGDFNDDGDKTYIPGEKEKDPYKEVKPNEDGSYTDENKTPNDPSDDKTYIPVDKDNDGKADGLVEVKPNGDGTYGDDANGDGTFGGNGDNDYKSNGKGLFVIFKAEAAPATNTGDDFDLLLMMTIMLLTMAVMSIVVYAGRRRA